jgi:glycosyltransferase involved in cell wall biosynthesis
VSGARPLVGLDATPLLGQRTGVGHYTAGLVSGLAGLAEPPELLLVPFTWRGAEGLAAPAGARVAHRRAPARLLQAAWARTRLPPVEWLAPGAGRAMDVFHATNFVAPPARRAAVVVTVHDLTFLHATELVSRASARYRTLVPRSLARAAVVCTPSAAVAAEVADAYRVAPERVVVTPLGVRDAFRTAAPPSPEWLAARGISGRYALFSGNLEPRKNLPVLLAAWRELLEERLGGAEAPTLVLAGPSGWGPALELAGLPDGAVRATGYLGDGELAALCAGAAVLAYPSLYEGFGLPPLEAMAAGVPVVAADLPVLRETLGDLAVLVDPGDATAMAGALAKVLGDDGGPEEAAARRAHAASFTWAACAEATMGAYRTAIEHGPGGAR